MTMIKALGGAVKHSFSSLKLLEIEREEAGPNELEIDVLYCGVCHSDVHQCENDWGNTVYPRMPGHEIVGRVPVVWTRSDRSRDGAPAYAVSVRPADVEARLALFLNGYSVPDLKTSWFRDDARAFAGGPAGCTKRRRGNE